MLYKTKKYWLEWLFSIELNFDISLTYIQINF